MDNPFAKRATEFLRDDEAFLAVVSPSPITYHLKRPGQQGVLYNQLVQIQGTPGSGKTTLARLFEFSSLMVLLRNTAHEGYSELVAALRECGAVANSQPTLLGVRIPLESDFRDFWEFDYSDELKVNLMSALMQARAVLGWFRHLQAFAISPSDVRLVSRKEADAFTGTIGGTDGQNVYDKARTVEEAIYRVATALVPPSPDRLPAEASGPYQPFSIIEALAVPGNAFGLNSPVSLTPLVIFDDAHILHPDQLAALERVLARRELRIARWLITRFDILQPKDAIGSLTRDPVEGANYPGITADRDVKQIILQGGDGRSVERNRFRTVARDMATRYMRRMPLLSQRKLDVLGNVLANTWNPTKNAAAERLRGAISVAQRKHKVTDDQMAVFRQAIIEGNYASAESSQELLLAMQMVMLNRLAGRRGRATASLFDDSEQDDEPTVAANDSVREAAQFQLFHEYDCPYYYGFHDVCDASSGNAEQFLQLSSVLIDGIVNHVIRGDSPTLSAEEQHKLLRKKAATAMASWNFPDVSLVRVVTEHIAAQCLRTSLRPNGAVIANAYGVLQEELDSVPKDFPRFARVIQFATAYNAINLVPHHKCKGKVWCLLELGGMPLLKYGLTLKRGGFLEGSVRELARVAGVDEA